MNKIFVYYKHIFCSTESCIFTVTVLVTNVLFKAMVVHSDRSMHQMHGIEYSQVFSVEAVSIKSYVPWATVMELNIFAYVP